MTILNFIVIIVFAILILALYITPSVIAAVRGHRNTVPLMVINLFLGWSGIFWVLTLAWSFWNEAAPKPAKKDDDDKKSGSALPIILIGGAFLLLLALFIFGLISNGMNFANITPATSNVTSITPTTPNSNGVPLSADEFLRNR